MSKHLPRSQRGLIDPSRQSGVGLGTQLYDGEGESREWLSILADIMMLTIVFFVYYVTFVEVEARMEAGTVAASALPDKELATTLQDVLPAHSGLLPLVMGAMPQGQAQGVTVTSLDANRLMIRVEGDVHFATASTEISADMRSVLDSLVPLLLKDESLSVAIHGHTDNVPIHRERFRDNWELSVLRSTETLRYLLDRGVDARRLSASGHGESMPIASNDSEAGREQNRRIEVVLERKTRPQATW